MRPLVLLALLLWLPLIPSTLISQERTFRVEPIAEGVHLIASSHGGDPNILVAAGQDRLLLVDGIWSDVVDDLVAAVRTISALPIGDVVLTHWHPDHTQGNAELREQGITVWAHTAAQRRMRTGNPIEYFDLDVPPYSAEALADSTVSSARVLRLGDREVHLIPVLPAHTDGDVMVHFPAANVLHMGDLKLGGIYPFVELSSGGDVEGLIAALDQALALADENTVVVPGHGPLAGRADLAAYRDLLDTVWRRVREGVAEGRSLDEVIAMRPAAEFDSAWSTELIPTERFVGILYQAASARSAGGSK